MANKVLYVEVSASGHRIEYIQNMIDFSYQNVDVEAYFLLTPDFKNKLSGLEELSNVYYFEEHTGTTNKLLKLYRYLLLYKFAIRLAQKHSINSVFFMFLNEFYLYALFSFSDINISGIAFHVNYRKSLPLSLKNRIKDYLFFKFSQKKSVQTIHILNDRDCVKEYNAKSETKVFRFLADPVTSFHNELSISAFENLNKVYSPDKINILHAGVLSHRKGTDVFLKALCNLSENDISNFRVFLVGRAVEPFGNSIQDLIDKLPLSLEFIYISDFVSNEYLQAYIEFSNAVVLPYRNTESSSGMIVRSMLENKYILAPSEGLVHGVLQDYGLYLPIKECTPQSLVESLNELQKSCTNSTQKNWGFDSKSSYEKYREQVSPINFVKSLIRDE